MENDEFLQTQNDQIEMQLSEKTLLLNDNSTQKGSEDEDEDEDENENENVNVKKKRLLTIAALGASMLVQSFLLVGVFPYSGFMAIHLVPNLNEETAGSYAGLIASSFMVGRTLTAFEWGRVADRHGRVFVIKASLLLSAIFSILFGLAPTFSMALISRCILGLCNGLLGPIKTLISEYCQGNKSKETEMVALVFGMWGYGFLINPAITGYLADPVKQYPNSKVVEVFEPFLRAYPFFPPNLVGCLFCLIAYILVHNYVEETLPPEKLQPFGLHTIFPYKNNIMRTVSSWGLFKHLLEDDVRTSEEAAIFLPPFKEEGEQQRVKEEEKPATIYSLWKRKATRQHLLVGWFFSFLIVNVDELFPLYCLSKTSGLAIEEKSIGNILSGTGVVYVTFQYFLLTGLVRRFGFYKSLKIGAFLSVPFCCLIPLSLITNKSAPEGTLTWSTYILLSMVYAFVRGFASLVFSILTMTTNRTVPAHHRGTMNGLAMLGGSFAKSLGPAFAGVLFSSSVGHFTPPIGSIVVFGIISILGLCLGVQALMLQAPKQSESLGRLVEVEQERCIKNDEEEDKPPTF